MHPNGKYYINFILAQNEITLINDNILFCDHIPGNQKILVLSSTAITNGVVYKLDGNIQFTETNYKFSCNSNY